MTLVTLLMLLSIEEEREEETAEDFRLWFHLLGRDFKPATRSFRDGSEPLLLLLLGTEDAGGSLAGSLVDLSPVGGGVEGGERDEWESGRV